MCIGCKACKSARHDAVAAQRGYGINPYSQGACGKSVGISRVPNGSLRKRQVLLCDEGMGARAHARDQRVALVCIEFAAEHRPEFLIRKRRFDN